jgi:predicted  nucleic acid-binding Zn-ribbon protein
LIESTQAALQKNIDINSEDIDALEKTIGDINKSIEKLNNDLINIDIAPKITDWLKNNLSDTI